MKVQKRHLQTEPPAGLKNQTGGVRSAAGLLLALVEARMKNHTNHARHYAGLTLALIGLIASATLVLGTARLASAQAVAPSWSYTGNLSTGRKSHTATMLQNGKVLVAGGIDASNILNSAGLYDSATLTWRSTGSLSIPRHLCTATLLPDGRVLIAGGYTSTDPPNFGVTNTAELYDPGSGTWSPTGNLTSTRAWHTATLLRSGKVLVAGGATNDITNTAELWDPVTGIWTGTGSLTTARYGQTATLLQDGNVLIAGGSDDGDLSTTLASVELFEPVAGTWTSIDSLGTARVLHMATLLPGGKVLASGGYTRGYNWPPTSLNSAELYDPATRNWSHAGTLNGARNSHTATLLPSGQVLVAGGDDWNRRVNLTSAELYDLSAGSWTIMADLNTARLDHSATLLPTGKVLVAGGFNNISGTLDSAELYDPGTVPVSNPIDDAQFFVRQHYRDFLNREPDADGIAFWTNEIIFCGADQGCIEAKRINVSAAFFLSIEFQQTGYLVYRIYESSYGNLPGMPVPIKLNEFLPDTQGMSQGVIVNQTGWEQLLENNKQAFTSDFVQRSRFTSAFPTSMTPTEFVDKLFANAGLTPSGADYLAALNEFGSATNSADVAARSRALRLVAESSPLAQQEFNRAFVLMQYFGYLGRNPNDPPEPRLNLDGYNFWLTKLTQFNGDYLGAEMVKAFITSGEYRQRFGP